jgi:hypothetical protein
MKYDVFLVKQNALGVNSNRGKHPDDGFRRKALYVVAGGGVQ